MFERGWEENTKYLQKHLLNAVYAVERCIMLCVSVCDKLLNTINWEEQLGYIYIIQLAYCFSHQEFNASCTKKTKGYCISHLSTKCSNIFAQVLFSKAMELTVFFDISYLNKKPYSWVVSAKAWLVFLTLWTTKNYYTLIFSFVKNILFSKRDLFYCRWNIN